MKSRSNSSLTWPDFGQPDPVGEAAGADDHDSFDRVLRFNGAAEHLAEVVAPLGSGPRRVDAVHDDGNERVLGHRDRDA